MEEGVGHRLVQEGEVVEGLQVLEGAGHSWGPVEEGVGQQARELEEAGLVASSG